MPNTLEAELFTFLCRKYTQTSDRRQSEMGLQYMLAETNDLARTLAGFMTSKLDDAIDQLSGVKDRMAALRLMAEGQGVRAYQLGDGSNGDAMAKLFPHKWIGTYSIRGSKHETGICHSEDQALQVAMNAQRNEHG